MLWYISKYFDFNSKRARQIIIILNIKAYEYLTSKCNFFVATIINNTYETLQLYIEIDMLYAVRLWATDIQVEIGFDDEYKLNSNGKTLEYIIDYFWDITENIKQQNKIKKEFVITNFSNEEINKIYEENFSFSMHFLYDESIEYFIAEYDLNDNVHDRKLKYFLIVIKKLLDANLISLSPPKKTLIKNQIYVIEYLKENIPIHFLSKECEYLENEHLPDIIWIDTGNKELVLQ